MFRQMDTSPFFFFLKHPTEKEACLRHGFTGFTVGLLQEERDPLLLSLFIGQLYTWLYGENKHLGIRRQA